MVSATKDPLTFNDLMATPIDFSKYVLIGFKIENLTQDILLGPAFNLLKDKLDWNNPEGDRYPFDLSKPLPLQGPPGHRPIVADYFFSNDLEYLKTSDPEVRYTSSITKTKVARYEIKGIKDMVPTLWSTIKHAYDKDAEKGNQAQGVSVKKLHGYGHLEDIVVKRSDQQLHKFKEGDFVNLYLNNIEDMLLIAVQHKLFHLDGSVIVNFIVALRMFTRSLILKKRPLSKIYQLGFSDGTSKSVRVRIHQEDLTLSGLQHRDAKEKVDGSSSSLDSESVEDRLVHYKKNEAVFEESINVLKLEVRLRDNALDEYKMKWEKAKNDNTATVVSPALESFVNLSDKSGSDKGYHLVPPPLTGNFIPHKLDLTFIDEIVESENMDVTTVVTPSNVKTVENKGVSNTVKYYTVRRECCAPINEELVSDGKKKTVFPTISKIEFVGPKQPEKQ
ncbi:hypothetical protein Tco_0015249 [Tanacetum coccineum]